MLFSQSTGNVCSAYVMINRLLCCALLVAAVAAFWARPVLADVGSATLSSIPPDFAEMDILTSLSVEEFMNKYLLDGKPFVLRSLSDNWPEQLSPNKLHSFWNIDNLQKVFPEDFRPEDGIMMADKEEVRKILREHHTPPAILNYRGRAPDVGVEYLFPSPAIPVGPNAKHIDAGCMYSYAIQMQGAKMWLLWPPKGNLSSSNDPNKVKLKPVAAILEPGDAVFFYPGWDHETHIIEAPSLSMSIYWMHPNEEFRPVHYLEQFGAYLIRTYQQEYCWCAGEWHLASRLQREDNCKSGSFIAVEHLWSKGMAFLFMASSIVSLVAPAIIIQGLIRRRFLERAKLSPKSAVHSSVDPHNN